MNDPQIFNPRKGGCRKLIELRDDETLQPFSSKELQKIFKVSHQAIAVRKNVLGISGQAVNWAELNNLFLLHIFVSSKYPHHTYYQFQNLYIHCLKHNLSIEKEVFEKMLMLDITTQLKEFESDVIQRVRSLRKQHNTTGTYRVISADSEVSTQGGATEAT